MKKVALLGIGSYLPQKFSADDIIGLWGKPASVVMKFTSINTRHYCLDPKSGKRDETNSDMAVKAAMKALSHAGITPQDVDLLILSTVTPDYTLPTTVGFVQDKLGIKNCTPLEIRADTVGFGQGFSTAYEFLQTGKYKTALVIGSEIYSSSLSHFLTHPNSIGECRLGDLITLVITSDGAGAVVLQVSETQDNVIGTCLGSAGFNESPGLVWPNFFEAMMDNEPDPVVKYQKLVNFDYDVSMRILPTTGKKALEHLTSVTNCKIENVDKFVWPAPSDAERRKRIAKDTGITVDKMIGNITDTGYLGNVWFPLALDTAIQQDQIKAGEIVMILGGDPTKFSYFGILLNWPEFKQGRNR